jgi:predicted nucleic acid-binding protein
LAPDLVLVELLNTAWKSLRMGAITSEQFQVLAHRAAEPFSRLFPFTALLARAGHWCRELDHPAYDCLYVALAEQERATLITADQRLLRKLAEPRPELPAAMDLAGLSG